MKHLVMLADENLGDEGTSLPAQNRVADADRLKVGDQGIGQEESEQQTPR